MEEIWKDIEGYEGLYQISSQGRVRSLDRTIVYSNGNVHKYYGSFKKQSFDAGGYKIVTLSKNSKTTTHKVHRLVAKAFIENPKNFKNINHIDEDKTNNNVDNLEWCDTAYNNSYGTRLERVSKTAGTPIVQLTIDGDYVNTYNSISAAAKSVGGNAAPIRDVLVGNSYISYGYCWWYEWEYENIYGKGSTVQ